jgi:hypothetical protein
LEGAVALLQGFDFDGVRHYGSPQRHGDTEKSLRKADAVVGRDAAYCPGNVESTEVGESTEKQSSPRRRRDAEKKKSKPESAEGAESAEETAGAGCGGRFRGDNWPPMNAGRRR